MQISGDRWAADTSVAVAALDSAHSAHGICRNEVVNRRPALSGHATFEVFSVLTRVPGRLAVDASTAWTAIDGLFPRRCWLAEAESDQLLRRCAAIGVRGGAVYDALVGATALANDLVLLTRDLRARRTYDQLGVAYELVGV
jgi:predicted nucleic acid-binding protein